MPNKTTEQIIECEYCGAELSDCGCPSLFEEATLILTRLDEIAEHGADYTQFFNVREHLRQALEREKRNQ